MKVIFQDIAKYKIQVIDYLSDFILKFKIDMPEIYNERWALYEEQINKEGSKTLKYLQNEINWKNYEMIGDRDELVKINFNHCFKADYYFSNGQKIISVIESDGHYQMGIHKSNHSFTEWFYPHSFFIGFSLESCFINKFQTLEKLYSEIIGELSKIEVQRISLEHDSLIDFIEIQKVHLSDYILRYDNHEKYLNLKYEGPTFDTEFKEFLKLIKPRKAICCIECKHFQFSGMSHDMSGGHTGYCKIMQSKLSEPNIKQSVTNITNSCLSFSRIENER